jgi:CelD/BcsL family acetyltransferase involved in cellulose biosynthesis
MNLCPEPLWESLARADETATFFQTPAWHALGARHFRAETAPLLFDLPGGPACLPLLRRRRWGRWLYFSPFGTYAALLCPRALGPGEIAAVEAALRPLNVHLISSPFTRNPVRVGRAVPARVQVLGLEGADPGNPMRDWSPDPRRKVRMAREAGVRIRIAEDADDWSAYFAVYQKSLRRWGARATAAHPGDLFAEIRKLPGDAMRLWLAESDGPGGGVVAGYLAFYHNRHAGIWHGASDPEFFRLGAVQLLYHDMTAHAARAGYPLFDLMGDGGNASLEAFKASLGAKTLKFDSFLNRAGIVGRLAAWRDRERG